MAGRNALQEGVNTINNPLYTNSQLVDTSNNKVALRNNTLESEYELAINLRAHICTNNTTFDNLSSGGTFIGEWQDIMDYVDIIVNIGSDQNSATDGCRIEFSYDAVNALDSEIYTITANRYKKFSASTEMKYFRVNYTNGAVATTSFFIISRLNRVRSKPSSHRISDSIVAQDDAELVKAVLTGETPAGEFTNFQATRNGNFKVAVYEYGDTPSIDSFDRLRVSTPYTIFDSKQLHDKQPLFWDETLGGSATSVHVPSDACTVMTVTAGSSDYVLRQTKQRFNYQPGKSQLILMTFHAPPVIGIVNRIGIFDGTGVNYLTPNNGVFFECNNDISWNIAKNGTITETVTQANWNYDVLDGTGASGVTLDMNDAQILIVDYEWLGVGRVRVGFVINGVIRYCHYFNHANNSFTSVYMSTPNLPLRYSIQTDGTNGSTLDHICSTVMSEGGLEKTGILRSVDTGAGYITGLNAGTAYALLGIRLKSTYNDITVIPEDLSAIVGSNDTFRWRLLLNPTVAGTFTYNDITNSACQYAVGTAANTVTGGLSIATGFSSVSNQTSGKELKTALRIGSTIAGTMDALVLVVTPISNNTSASGAIGFRELL